MPRRDPAVVFQELPDWQRRTLSYLGLGPDPPARPTWLRVLSGIAAVVLAAGTIVEIVQGDWARAVVSGLLTLAAALGTRRQHPSSRFDPYRRT